jgi:hypothetical protein
MSNGNFSLIQLYNISGEMSRKEGKKVIFIWVIGSGFIRVCHIAVESIYLGDYFIICDIIRCPLAPYAAFLNFCQSLVHCDYKKESRWLSFITCNFKF